VSYLYNPDKKEVKTMARILKVIVLDYIDSASIKLDSLRHNLHREETPSEESKQLASNIHYMATLIKMLLNEPQNQ